MTLFYDEYIYFAITIFLYARNRTIRSCERSYFCGKINLEWKIYPTLRVSKAENL